jgi:hypothetical protein
MDTSLGVNLRGEIRGRYGLLSLKIDIPYLL